MDQPQTTSAPQPVISSFTTRMMNVFMAPSELLAEVANAPVQTTSWLLPMIITMILSAIFTFIIFSNPSFRHTMMEQQTAAIQERVAKGEMTQEQADKASEMMESGNIVLITGIIGSLIVPAVMLFLAALCLWLVLKLILKSSAGYKKALELCGLSSLVGVLGIIVTLILMHLFDTLHATPGGQLLVMNSFDRTNVTHKLLSSITIFGVWQTAIIGIGLGKLSGKSTGAGMGVSFALWALLVILSTFTGFGIL